MRAAYPRAAIIQLAWPLEQLAGALGPFKVGLELGRREGGTHHQAHTILLACLSSLQAHWDLSRWGDGRLQADRTWLGQLSSLPRCKAGQWHPKQTWCTHVAV